MAARTGKPSRAGGRAALPPAPPAHADFVRDFSKLAAAWDLAAAAGEEGPLDEKTRRLVKLALAAGALREGAFHAAARKARAAGVSEAAIRQVIALAATTVGFPSAVALYSWSRDVKKK